MTYTDFSFHLSLFGPSETLYFWRERETKLFIKYPIITIISSKRTELGLEESSEVERFTGPKMAQIEAELFVSGLGGSFW